MLAREQIMWSLVAFGRWSLTTDQILKQQNIPIGIVAIQECAQNSDFFCDTADVYSS